MAEARVLLKNLFQVLSTYALERMQSDLAIPTSIQEDIRQVLTLGARQKKERFTILTRIYEGTRHIVALYPAGDAIQKSLLDVGGVSRREIQQLLEGQEQLSQQIDSLSRRLDGLLPPDPDPSPINVPPTVQEPARRPKPSKTKLEPLTPAKQHVNEHYAEWVERWPDLFSEQPLEGPRKKGEWMSLNEQGARYVLAGVTNELELVALRKGHPEYKLPSRFWASGLSTSQQGAKRSVGIKLRREWWETLPAKPFGLKFQILLALPFDMGSLQPTS